MDFENALRKIADAGKEQSAKNLLERVKEETGEVPLIYRKMAKKPEVLIGHLLYKCAVTETSSLEPKTVELISLAVGSALTAPNIICGLQWPKVRRRMRFWRACFLQRLLHRRLCLQTHTGS